MNSSSRVAARLLRRKLRDWATAHASARRLTFRQSFRTAGEFALLDEDACERWLAYRDLRNESAHDYDDAVAEGVMETLPDFRKDAKALVRALRKAGDE